MPWRKINVQEELEKEFIRDPEFKKVWEDSRMEYEMLGQLIKLYNEKGLTIEELAEKSGEEKQLLSEIIEERGERLTLPTLYRVADALGADVRLIPR